VIEDIEVALDGEGMARHDDDERDILGIAGRGSKTSVRDAPPRLFSHMIVAGLTNLRDRI
jgi:hypothetical protein